MKPVLKYPGAKWNLAQWIISFFPAHTTYLEPFFGSGAVFFNKLPSQKEVINDLDDNAVNLFRMIREKPEELAALIEATPWARTEYLDSYSKTGDNLEDARRFLVRCWQAFAGRLGHRSGWCHSGAKGMPHMNRWRRLPKQILLASERLLMAEIENRPAVRLIQEYCYPNVLIYADPPYVWETRSDRQSGRKMYFQEMTDADHIELLDALDAHPGPVILSGYACDLYDNRLNHWRRETRKAQAEKGQTRTEVLWINPVAAKEIQGRLF